MFVYQRRIELESKARLLGYEPERDDTDADLVLVINMRSSRTGRISIDDQRADSQAVFPPHATARRG